LICGTSSSAQFNCADLTLVVSDALKAAPLEQSGLELELPETVVICRPEDAIAQLGRLAGAFRLTISARVFQPEPIASPAVRSTQDRPFLRATPRRGPRFDRASTALAASIFALEHGLGMEVIAEGVETETQLRLLENLECRDT
jgi:EAL domain-containing protein (putative c-di-GMP-specific phosphodiesterase class I)